MPETQAAFSFQRVGKRCSLTSLTSQLIPTKLRSEGKPDVMSLSYLVLNTDLFRNPLWF